MPSPFPGMDPYFEDPAYWEAFHHQFISECSNQLSDRLGPGYVANIAERVELVSYDDEAARQYVPDVAIAREPQAAPAATRTAPAATEAVATIEPVTIPAVGTLEVRQGIVEILRAGDMELVTAVEVLSPWNKFGAGAAEYRQKRDNLVGGAGVNVVELDLLVRGQRTRLAAPLPPGDYYAMVFDAARRPDVRVWAWGVRRALPTHLPVPLRSPDPPVSLDLAAVVRSVYDRGRYDRKLRYAKPCPAPLSPDDVAWAEAIARGASA